MNCPICAAKTKQSHRPFCSRHCADLDLAKWLNGSYAVPSNDPEDIENAMKETEKGNSISKDSLPIRH